MARTRLPALAAALMTAAASLGAASAQAADKCEMATVSELPVKFVNNRPTVEVFINGRSNRFILDTGAAYTLLTSVAAQENSLAEHTLQWLRFSGVGGEQDAKSAVAQTFTFGSLKIKNAQLLITSGGAGLDAAGLLGRDYLGQTDLELDLTHNVVRFLSPKHCGTQSEAYWTDHAIEAELIHEEATSPFFVAVKVNGHPYRALVDTGAQVSVITTEAAREMGVQGRQLTATQNYVGGMGEHVVAFSFGVFNQISIGGEQIANAKLQVADLFKHNRQVSVGSMLAKREPDRDEPGMILGADYLRSHRVLLSNSQKVFYATYYGGPIFQITGSGVSGPATAPKQDTPPPRQGAAPAG